MGEQSVRDLLGTPESATRGIGPVVSDWLPRRLAQSLCDVAGIRFDLPVAELGRKRMAAIIQQLKSCELAVNGTLGFAKAEVTAGGVDLDEVDDQTMASRILDGLFLAGEILDVDGPIGGYNFQAAWSTGRLAGISAARNLRT